ncbi:hypothetical protein [Chitinophaga pinensis]|uniref:Uncharacterized protein n=1 Tax=Chitinophaga pinensis (strain ATCC 43595 / DSM 2588 / LMG 13176 / NBRC 15968 / NCIMB 11800 / UQM 2034) TaxID=485918 RepID=A0A979GAZ6_CHIPD|nr:hypothetical protein [Chitinophaga pinensis]ACU64076.1 hypothetical protein Cpin_6673 [Chitinophaga pinensis DSM 2588]
MSKDKRLYFRSNRPDSKALSFYAEQSTVLLKDRNGYYLEFADVTIKKIYRKVLLHEIGHCVAPIHKGGWSPAYEEN